MQPLTSGYLIRNYLVSLSISHGRNWRGPIFPPEILVCPYVTALLNIIHCFMNAFAFAGKSGQFHIMVKMQVKLKRYVSFCVVLKAAGLSNKVTFLDLIVRASTCTSV